MLSLNLIKSIRKIDHNFFRRVKDKFLLEKQEYIGLENFEINSFDDHLIVTKTSTYNNPEFYNEKYYDESKDYNTDFFTPGKLDDVEIDEALNKCLKNSVDHVIKNPLYII